MMVTVRAPINIAIVKYWGKRDEEQIIAMNDSVSVTLDMGLMYTETTVRCVGGTGSVEFELNGNSCRVSERMCKVISEFPKHTQFDMAISSVNSFPTAAGMASSASGMAALAVALNHALAGGCLDQDELSAVARLGSGSACRSVHGGFVKWHHLSATLLFDETHWPELRCLIAVVVKEQKKTPSRDGMQRTVHTSALYQKRLEQVDARIAKLEVAIESRDFGGFAEICMTESNQLHAVCLDSFPPIHYLTDDSFQIIDKIHELNASGTKAAYTFDAGPNAFIFTLQQHVDMLKAVFSEYDLVECRVGGPPRVSKS